MEKCENYIVIFPNMAWNIIEANIGPLICVVLCRYCSVDLALEEQEAS